MLIPCMYPDQTLNFKTTHIKLDRMSRHWQTKLTTAYLDSALSPGYILIMSSGFWMASRTRCQCYKTFFFSSYSPLTVVAKS
jgi:hypothetical protein